MISIEQARQSVKTHVHRLKEQEVPLAKALGRVLARDILADSDYPTAARATMDGYVIRGDDSPGKFQIIGEVAAGEVSQYELKSREAMRIFTGAVIPEQGGRVIMQEQVTLDGNAMISGDFPENHFVRWQASEARQGEVVLPAGTLIGAAEIAILAQVGAIRPRLVQQPVLRHLATGDELVGPEFKPQLGQIRDTNSAMIRSLVAGLGISLTDSQRVMDDPAALAIVAEGDWDVLLISGGASVGDYDFGAKTLCRLGFTLHFTNVNLRPGKPLTFATRGSQVAFVIPGNPVSHFVCYHAVIRHAIECLCGLPSSWNFLRLELVGGAPITLHPRDTLWPATVVAVDGKLVVSANHWSTSGDTFSLAASNALIRVNATTATHGLVETLLLNFS